MKKNNYIYEEKIVFLVLTKHLPQNISAILGQLILSDICLHIYMYCPDSIRVEVLINYRFVR